MHSFFVLFHIEAKDKSQFIYYMNSLMVELHEQLEDHEEQKNQESQNEEMKADQ